MPQNQLDKRQVFGIFLINHDIYYPHKPDKIQVVSDCSSDFQRRSLHKELLTGLDFTNQIVSVLLKFQKN